MLGSTPVTRARIFCTGLGMLVLCGCSKAALEDGSFNLELERTRCFGTCPVYSVQVDRTGKVSFEGRAFVNLKGHHEWQLSPSAFHTILRNIDDREILDLTQAKLDGACTEETSDAPTITLKITRKEKQLTLTDKGDCPSAGVVRNFRRFCEETDESIGTTQLFCKKETCDDEDLGRFRSRR
jgi:hypothetical protein